MVANIQQISKFAYVQKWTKMTKFEICINFATKFANKQIYFSSPEIEWRHSLVQKLSDPLKILHTPPSPQPINNDCSLSYLKNGLCILHLKYCMFTLTDVKYWINCNFLTLCLCVDRGLRYNKLSTISAGTFGNMPKLHSL